MESLYNNSAAVNVRAKATKEANTYMTTVPSISSELSELIHDMSFDLHIIDNARIEINSLIDEAFKMTKIPELSDDAWLAYEQIKTYLYKVISLYRTALSERTTAIAMANNGDIDRVKQSHKEVEDTKKMAINQSSQARFYWLHHSLKKQQPINAQSSVVEYVPLEQSHVPSAPPFTRHNTYFSHMSSPLERHHTYVNSRTLENPAGGKRRRTNHKKYKNKNRTRRSR
jgi:hypothetical protein